MSTRSVPPELIGLIERPIAVYPVYARIAGGIDGGVILAQMVYWATAPAARGRGGWWCHQMPCLARQTGATLSAVQRARKRLRDLGLLDERQTAGALVAARLDLSRLAALVEEHGGGGGTECCCDRAQAARAATIAARDDPDVEISTSGCTDVADPDLDITRSHYTRDYSQRHRRRARDDSPAAQRDDDDPRSRDDVEAAVAARVAASIADGGVRDARAYVARALAAAGRAADDGAIGRVLAAAREWAGVEEAARVETAGETEAARARRELEAEIAGLEALAASTADGEIERQLRAQIDDRRARLDALRQPRATT